MIVVNDTFSWCNYPVYVLSEENVHEEESKYKDKNMQKVMEVYNLMENIDIQLNSKRSFSY